MSIVRLTVIVLFLTCINCNRAFPIESNPSNLTRVSSTGFIITAGGNVYSGPHTSSSYYFDLLQKEWGDLPPLLSTRAYFNLVYNQGVIHAVAGETSPFVPTNSHEVFYAASNRWMLDAPLPVSGCATSVSMDGDIYEMGGSGNQWDMHNMIFNQFFKIDATGQSHSLPATHYDHWHSNSAVIDGKIYVCAGDAYPSSRCEYFDSDKNTWIETTPMSVIRDTPCVVALNGYLWVFAGAAGPGERYDPSNDQWSLIPSPFTEFTRDVAAVTDGIHIYAIGGYVVGKQNLNSVYQYRTDLNMWLSIGTYPQELGGIGAVYVPHWPE